MLINGTQMTQSQQLNQYMLSMASMLRLTSVCNMAGYVLRYFQLT